MIENQHQYKTRAQCPDSRVHTHRVLLHANYGFPELIGNTAWTQQVQSYISITLAKDPEKASEHCSYDGSDTNRRVEATLDGAHLGLLHMTKALKAP
jgi:hypothetical protein